LRCRNKKNFNPLSAAGEERVVGEATTG